MKAIRNLLFLIPLTILMTFCSSYTAFARSKDATLSEPKLLSGTGASFERITENKSDISIQSVTTNNIPLIEYFREQTEAFSEAIDVSEYNIPEQDFEEIYEMLVFCSPRSYYLTANNGTYQYYAPDFTENENGESIVEYIFPLYQLDIYEEDGNLDKNKLETLKPEINANQQLFDVFVEKIHQYINPNAKDSEKVIRYHNSIDIIFSYANDDLLLPIEDRTHNNVIQFVKQRKGLCQTYAIFYNYLLMQEGFETGFVTSFDQHGNNYHTWNLVKITTDATHDNTPHWYHVDSTWDDLHHDGFGLTSMNYLLRSDKAIQKTHNNVEIDDLIITYPEISVETSTAFDDAHWHDAVSQIVIYGGKWYYITHHSGGEYTSALCSYNPHIEGNPEEIIYTFNDKWYTDSSKTSYYDMTASGLGRMSGHLYFNGPDVIYNYDIHSGEVTTVDTPELPDGYSIVSSYVQGTIVHYGISTLANGQIYDAIEGGTVRLSIMAFSEATIRNNVLSISFATDPECGHVHEVMLFVKNGDKIKLWDGIVDGIKYVNVPLESNEIPKLYIWDENMTPYTTFYYIDGQYYDYN